MEPKKVRAYGKRAVSILVLLALVLSGLAVCGRALAVSDGPEKNGPFLAEDRQYDVLFFGSSHVVNDVFPMALWKSCGLTSYNLGGHGASIAASYWQLRLATQVHKPKVAVLDVLFAGSEYTRMEIGLAHELLDIYPMSRLKAEAVCDLFEDSGDRAELLFPLDVYHNRWKELDAKMLRRGMTGDVDFSPEKGSQIRTEIYPLEQLPLIPEGQVREETFLAMTYVEKFVTYCQENGILPVLIYLPCQISEQWQLDCNRAIALGEQLGAKTLNLQYLDLIDYTTDWYDDGSHLNPAGALKTTACLGAFLREQCGLEDHRGDSAYEVWDRDYENYVNYLERQMANQTTAGQILSLAAMEPFTVEAYVSEAFSDASVLRQLEHLGVTPGRLASGGRLTLTVRDSQGNVLRTAAFTRKATLEETKE